MYRLKEILAKNLNTEPARGLYKRIIIVINEAIISAGKTVINATKNNTINKATVSIIDNLLNLYKKTRSPIPK